ncbi:alpha/beta hydrolase, partial [Patescibacteria group bacterium]
GREQYDLEGAIRYLKNRPEIDKNRIGVFGFSMGGAVAVLKGGDIPEIRAVVINSTFSRMSEVIKKNFRDYLPAVPFMPFGYIGLLYIRLRTGVYFPHIKPAEYISKLDPRPVLIIHGSRDETVPSQQAFELLKSSRGNTELWTIPGADHHGAYKVMQEKYEKRIIDFYTKHLLAAHSQE